MAGTLDYVHKGEAITAEKWNALVERINALEQETCFGFGVTRRPKGGGGPVLKPCRLLSSWAQNDAGVWQGRACFIIPETGRPDPSFVFDVYCPAASGRPEGEPYSWRFWAAYDKDRKRWESLQQPVYQRIYVGGSYISAGAYDVDLGGYRIDNEGLTNAVVPGDAYSNTKTLYFNRHFFQWIPSTLDIVGKKEISLVGRYETVLTPNGEKHIFVLGPAN